MAPTAVVLAFGVVHSGAGPVVCKLAIAVLSTGAAQLDSAMALLEHGLAAPIATFAARSAHLADRRDRVVTAQLARQIRLVDGVTRYRCGDDPDVMGEWKAAKQVLGQGVRGDP